LLRDNLTLRTSDAQDATSNATSNDTSNATSAIATDSASCQVGDNVTAIWQGDGRMYPANIHELGDDGTLTVNWDDGDTTFRTMPADSAQKAGFVCEPIIKDKPQNTGMVVLALCILFVSIGVCSCAIWLADGKLKQSRDSKVAPADPESKLQCSVDEDEAAAIESTPAKPLEDSALESSPPQGAAADTQQAQSTDSTPKAAASAAPLEETSLFTEHIEEPPPAASQAPPEDIAEDAVPPAASSAPPASSAMDEARAAGTSVSAPLEPPGVVESPPQIFATPPPITEAEQKALSEWNDGVHEEPLSESDAESAAAKSEESV